MFSNRDSNSSLTSLSEPFDSLSSSISSLLSSRLAQGNPYTEAGDGILVSLNPYTPSLTQQGSGIPLYAEVTSHSYKSGSLESLPPHIFAIAQRAMTSLHKGPQGIVVSGVSGSGKTEANRLLISHVCSGDPAVLSKLNATTILLEAFGNACTVNNNNSSRFGKLLTVELSPAGSKVLGGAVSTYLLETHRVTSQSPGERSFHILHYLLAGLRAGSFTSPHLDPSHSYHYLSQASATSLPSDLPSWLGVNECLRVAGVPQGVSDEWLGVLQAVLLLGELTFTPVEGSNSGGCTLVPSPHLDSLVTLLGLPLDALATALTSSTLTIARDTVHRAHSLGEASVARDSLARSLYSILFQSLVTFCSSSMGGLSNTTTSTTTLPASRNTISLLDMYGFEDLGGPTGNNHSTLLINTANEALHTFFVRAAVVEEEALYKEEGLTLTPIILPDTSSTHGTLWGHPGLFSILKDFSSKGQSWGGRGDTGGTSAAAAAVSDSAGPAPSASVECDLAISLRSHLHPPGYVSREAPNLFAITHYAGVIEYSALSLGQDDIERVAAARILLPQCSSLPHLTQSLTLSLAATSSAGGGGSGGGSSSSSSSSNTLSSIFKVSLDSLVDFLAPKSLQWVRCVRPNKSQLPLTAEPLDVESQCKALGLPAAVAIRRNGFATRISHTALISRFSFLAPQFIKQGGGKGGGGVGALLASPPFNIPPTAFTVAKTRVFFPSASTLTALETLRTQAISAMFSQLGALFKGWKARRAYKAMRLHIIHGQALIKGYLARGALHRKKCAALTLSAFFRGSSVRISPAAQQLRSGLGLMVSSCGKKRSALSLSRLPIIITGGGGGGGVRAAALPPKTDWVAPPTPSPLYHAIHRLLKGRYTLLLTIPAQKLHTNTYPFTWVPRVVVVVGEGGGEGGGGSGGGGGGGGGGAGGHPHPHQQQLYITTFDPKSGGGCTKFTPLLGLGQVHMSPFSDDLITLSWGSSPSLPPSSHSLPHPPSSSTTTISTTSAPSITPPPFRSHSLTLFTPHKTQLAALLKLTPTISTGWPIMVKKGGGEGFTIKVVEGRGGAGGGGGGVPNTTISGKLMTLHATLVPKPSLKDILSIKEVRALQKMGVKAVGRITV